MGQIRIQGMGEELMDERLVEKIRSIRLLILDVDGVLTDGRIIMDDTGREIKNFDVRDGHGLKVLMRFGIAVVLLTGRRSSVVEHRARDLGIDEVHQGIFDKAGMLDEILQKRNLQSSHCAFIGDDIVDIPILKKVGLSVAVADATEDVKRVVDYTTTKQGGRGAVRELCEMILKGQGKWEEVARRYEFL